MLTPSNDFFKFCSLLIIYIQVKIFQSLENGQIFLLAIHSIIYISGFQNNIVRFQLLIPYSMSSSELDYAIIFSPYCTSHVFFSKLLKIEGKKEGGSPCFIAEQLKLIVNYVSNENNYNQ